MSAPAPRKWKLIYEDGCVLAIEGWTLRDDEEVSVIEMRAFEDVKEKLRLAEIELAEIKAARARANTNPVCADCNALLARF